MAFMQTVHGGGAPSLKESVYYTGSDTLLEGYALCYDFNAADVNSENVALTSPDVGEEYWNDARRVLVEKPSEANKIHFAGVVAKESDGVVGPGWVTIHKPGSICNVYAASDCDHEKTAGASGQLLNVCVAQYYMKHGGFPGCGAAIVLQDADKSSTNGLIMAELMTGPPSGGVNWSTVVSTHAGGSAPVLSDVLQGDPLFAGAYIIQEHDLGSTLISALMLAADGKWVGQKVGFYNSTVVSTAVSLIVSTIAKANYSAYAGAVASAVADISAAGEYSVYEFDGVRWQVKSSHESLITT